MSVVALPSRGFRKAFFFDNLWVNNATGLPTGAGVYNCHRPGTAEGQNICSGDGSVRWQQFGNKTSRGFGHPTTRGPKDYWVPITYCAVSTISAGAGIGVGDPTIASEWPSSVPVVYNWSSADNFSSAASIQKFRQYTALWR